MVLWFALLSCFTTSIYAFQLSPMSYTFSAKNPSHYFIISNDSSKREAVQITMAKRIMDKFGKEQHPEVEDTFIIFPDQLILKPQERRKIKVQLLKKDVPTIEQAYRLIAEQLPIDLKKKSDRKINTNINLLLRYIASIYVAPQEKKIEFKMVSAKKQGHKLLLTIQNSGTMHFLLKNLRVKISGTKNSYTYSPQELKGMFGENILAGHSRIFTLPFPKNILSNHFKVGIDFDQE